MYNKLFEKILDSSIWLEPTPTRIVWITLLAAMDEEGYAHFSALQNLADRAKVSLEEAREAVECFTHPDPDSGNQEHEGRRLERIPGGYIVLNAAYHRAMVSREIQKMRTRERVQRFRDKKRGVTKSNDSVTPSEAESGSESGSLRENSEPQAASESPVLSMVLNTGEPWPISQALVDYWQTLYRGIDVGLELRKMVAWFDANPNRRKTRMGIKRAVVGWLNRSQDRGLSRDIPSDVGRKLSAVEIVRRANADK